MAPVGDRSSTMRQKLLIKELEKTRGLELIFFPPIHPRLHIHWDPAWIPQPGSHLLHQLLTLISPTKNLCSPHRGQLGFIITACSWGYCSTHMLTCPPSLTFHLCCELSVLVGGGGVGGCNKPGRSGDAVICEVTTWSLHWASAPPFLLIEINTKVKIKLSLTPPPTDDDFNLSEYCLLIL